MLAMISTTFMYLGYRVPNLWVKNMHDFITKMNMLEENLSNLYIDLALGLQKLGLILENFGL